jgi:F-type H+-transporting ATPase subunit gamma
MSKRLEVRQHIALLDDIGGIMRAMKNMALIETRKLSRFMAHQQQTVASIEAVIVDFLHFYPQPHIPPAETLLVMIGSERGFCGDFNEQLITALMALPHTADLRLVTVGRRLATKLDTDGRVAARLDGPNVTEEVPRVLSALMETLNSLYAETTARLTLLALCHGEEATGVGAYPLLPLAAPPLDGRRFASPPVLHLAPAVFFVELVDHYLLALLHTLLYRSLMVENRRRLEHMETAIRRLEHQAAALRLRWNALRQEEIIEEIEVIMLNTDTLQASDTAEEARAQARQTPETDGVWQGA